MVRSRKSILKCWKPFGAQHVFAHKLMTYTMHTDDFGHNWVPSKYLTA
jgi:hypothetical protein